ncbi:hypothetical protein GJ496_010317 [Pomphorhynchus laevis]|nr:hypothetical protein GJ496_010317 [Pomphorhynchus laevis]
MDSDDLLEEKYVYRISPESLASGIYKIVSNTVYDTVDEVSRRLCLNDEENQFKNNVIKRLFSDDSTSLTSYFNNLFECILNGVINVEEQSNEIDNTVVQDNLDLSDNDDSGIDQKIETIVSNNRKIIELENTLNKLNEMNLTIKQKITDMKLQ